ncbi:MAG: DMT family protein [Propionivibrio sp.]|nr:DMT family protein [Propionivibrio sp.]
MWDSLHEDPGYLAGRVPAFRVEVPANRIGHSEYSLAQLKILQEIITLSMFVPFVVFYMQQPLKLDYLWAALCILGAVYFVFRS